MLYVTMMWHHIRARADRVRDDETGAISTVELLILVGLVVILVGAIWAILSRKITDKAESLNIT
jgi:hypothetical protein